MGYDHIMETVISEGVSKINKFAQDAMELDIDHEKQYEKKSISDNDINIIRTQTCNGMSQIHETELETYLNAQMQKKDDRNLVFDQFTLIDKEATERTRNINSVVGKKSVSSNDNDLSNIEKVERKLGEITEVSLIEE